MSSNPNDPHPTYGSYEQQLGASSFSAGEPFGGAQSTPQNAMMTEADYRQLGQTPPLSQPLYGAKPITAYIRFWKKYVRFKGYASRSEYWWPALINTLIFVGVYVLAVSVAAIGASMSDQTTYSGYNSEPVTPDIAISLMLFLALFGLSILLPLLSVGWRRIQDAGMHGALTFLYFIPFVGRFIVMVLCVFPSKPELRNPSYDDNTGD